jgi:hypothetical protein
MLCDDVRQRTMLSGVRVHADAAQNKEMAGTV